MKELAGNFCGGTKPMPARQGEERGKLKFGANSLSAASSPDGTGGKPGGGKLRDDVKLVPTPAPNAGASGAGGGKDIRDAKGLHAASRQTRKQEQMK